MAERTEAQRKQKIPPLKVMEYARFTSAQEENRDEAIRRLKIARREINRAICALEDQSGD